MTAVMAACFSQELRGHRAVFRMQELLGLGPVVWSVEFCGHVRRFTFEEWCDLGMPWAVTILNATSRGKVRTGELRTALRMLSKAATR